MSSSGSTDGGYLLPTAAVSLLLVMLAMTAVVTSSATRWLNDRADRRAADEAAVNDYAWPEIANILRSLNDPAGLLDRFDGWQAVGGGKCDEAGLLPDPPGTIDCWKIADVERLEQPESSPALVGGRNSIALSGELVRVAILTRVDCSTADPPGGGCALSGESQRTYARPGQLYFQAQFSEQTATPGAGHDGKLVFADGDNLARFHFAGAATDVCGQPTFGIVVMVDSDPTDQNVPEDFNQLCGGGDPTADVRWVQRPLGIVVDDSGDCRATPPDPIYWMDDLAWLHDLDGMDALVPHIYTESQLADKKRLIREARHKQAGDGAGRWLVDATGTVDLASASDGDVYFSPNEITVKGLADHGVSVSIASPADITVDLSTSSAMGTPIFPPPGAPIEDMGDATGASRIAAPPASIGEAGAVAYYRFEITEPKRMILGLRRQTDSSNTDLILLDTNGVEIASSRNDSARTEYIDIPPDTDSRVNLLAGTYYLRVEHHANSPNSYAVSVGAREPNQATVESLRADGFAERHSTRQSVVALVSGCDVVVRGPDPVSHIAPYTPCPEPPVAQPAGCSAPITQPAATDVMPLPGGAVPPQNDLSGGTSEHTALTTALAADRTGITLAMHNVAVFAPRGGLYAEDYNLSPGNCATPPPPMQSPSVAGEAEAFTQVEREGFVPCSLPTLAISGSVISKHRMLVGLQLPTTSGNAHYGGFVKDFTYPEDFWRAVPPWWPESAGDYWRPL